MREKVLSSTRGVAVLGSTGSIGSQTIELIAAYPEDFRLIALAAGKNLPSLREQIRKFRPLAVSVSRKEDADLLLQEFPGLNIGFGADGLRQCVELSEVDVVVMGIMGFAALEPTLDAIRLDKIVALANKEALVVAGCLLKKALAGSRACLIPVDSEHNALFQLLEKRLRQEISSLVLTASGGPLFRCPDLPLDDVTPAIATQHPNWKMGAKISVDSATLMNKGLELIEAHFLFDFPPERIEIWIHPQSIVHGAIHLVDNSCLAQLTKPDMKSSIGFAMAYPQRLPEAISRLTLGDISRLDFCEPDEKRFPALRIAREALSAGPSHLVALNAANEVIVQKFLEGGILFSRIPSLIQKALDAHRPVSMDSIDAVMELDRETRKVVGAFL